MSDLIPVDSEDDESGTLRFVLDLERGSSDPTPSGGTSDYNLLKNLPQINGVKLLGNITDEQLDIQKKMTPITISYINFLPDL